MPYSSLEELDAIFEAAMKKIPKKQKALNKAIAHPKEKYSNPSHWIPGRNIAIIHQDSGTLIGNFIEYTHQSETHCRKLVRADGEPSAFEYVQGSWWLGENIKAPRPLPSTTHYHIRIKLLLDELNLFTPSAALDIEVEHKGVRRAVLTEDTLFASETTDTLLTLPAGTNIYPLLGFTNKVYIKEELNL